MAQKSKYTNIDLSKYDKGYQKSQSVIDAENRKNLAINAVDNYGDFKYGNQEAYDKAMDAILNRKKFSYDLNGDALYQQYKDNYITQGKQAMMDTMGMASAMTGGYGNSYAATVGNQTYQGYLQQLNNKIPELYQLALDSYNSEGEQLANKLGVLAQDRQTAYGEWGDKYNRLVADRDYHSNEYNNAYNRDYTTWTDNRDYDTSQYWNEHNSGYQAEQDALQMAYQKERDAIADAQWQKEFAEAQRQFNAEQALNREKFAYQQAQDEAEAQKKQDEIDEINKYANSSGVKTFQASVLTPAELKRRGMTTMVGDTRQRFDTYEQYVDAVAEKWLKNKQLTPNEAQYIAYYYQGS